MAKQLGVTLVEILVTLCLINVAILLFVGDTIHRQKTLQFLQNKMKIRRQTENRLELAYVKNSF